MDVSVETSMSFLTLVFQTLPMRSCYHRYVLQENKSDFKPISDGVAIGCVLQESFKCTVDPDTSLNQGPNKTNNVPINTVSPPYTQIAPQAAILAIIPNEEMSMDFKIKVCDRVHFTL